MLAPSGCLLEGDLTRPPLSSPQSCAPTGLCSRGPSKPATCTGRTDTFSTLSPVTSMPTTVTMTTRRVRSSTHTAGPCGTVRLFSLYIHTGLYQDLRGIEALSCFVLFPSRTCSNGLRQGGRPAIARLPQRSPPTGHRCREHVKTAAAKAA